VNRGFAARKEGDVSFENAQRFQNSQKNSSGAAEGSDSKLAAWHS